MNEENNEVEVVNRIRPELAEWVEFLQNAMHTWQGVRLKQKYIYRNQAAFAAWLGIET